MASHKHAHLMATYAEDAKTSDTPWKNWEYCNNTATEPYRTCFTHPQWHSNACYRRTTLEQRQEQCFNSLYHAACGVRTAPWLTPVLRAALAVK